MPTTIKVVLPATQAEDTSSVTEDLFESSSSTAPTDIQSVDELDRPDMGGLSLSLGSPQNNMKVNDERSISLRPTKVNNNLHHHRFSHRRKHRHRENKNLNNNSSNNCGSDAIQEEQQRRTLQQTQLQMCDDYGPNRPVQAKTSHQRPHRRPASAAARLGSHPGEALAQSMDAHDTQQLSITDTYDVDLEYHDIMLKALRSYTQHRHIEQRGGGGSKARAVGNMQKLKTRVQNLQNLLSQPSSVVETEGELRCILDNNGVLDENGNNLSEDTFLDHSDPPKTFKLAQCRLQYHDEEAWAERRKSLNSNSKTTEHKPVSRAPPGTVLLYPPATSDGIKADSSGHVFRPPPSKREQKRPWTALPCKFSDYITRSPNLSHQYSALSENNQRNPRRQHSDVTEKHSSIPNTDKDKEVRGHPNESSKLNVLTLRLRAAKMSGQPIPRSVAYQRRNQTTHSWYDTGHMMSQSLPSGGFLHRQYTSSASSTPRSSRDATSEKGSPVVKSASARPSSSYSYDGGFFVGAHAGQAEYFVIHPDWVSEAMTIKKLSIGSKKGPSGAGAHMPKARARSWQGRRCMSAPPSKLRNPITWDHSDPVDIPRPKKK